MVQASAPKKQTSHTFGAAQHVVRASPAITDACKSRNLGAASYHPQLTQGRTCCRAARLTRRSHQVRALGVLLKVDAIFHGSPVRVLALIQTRTLEARPRVTRS